MLPSTPLANGLSANAYRGAGFWRQEQRRLFPGSWVLAGFVHQLPNPGDARPFTVGGQPILLLRDGSNQLRSFHNVCSHRCMKLLSRAGNVGNRIRCPYHAWLYDLNGNLRATPGFGGPDSNTPNGFDPGSHGLKEIRVGVWHDWIFVNLDNRAIDFAAFIAPMKTYLGDIDLSGYSHLATLEFGEIKTNWKFLVENFIEPYHVQFVHRDSTDQPLADHYTTMRDHCFGSGVEIRRKPSKAADGSLAVSSLYLSLFPSFIFGHYVPDQLGVYLLEPLAPDCTRQWRAIYSTRARQYTCNQVGKIKELWSRVHAEDHAVCEGMQEGRFSDAAREGGVLSPHWENVVLRFQEMVLQAVDETTIHPLHSHISINPRPKAGKTKV